ncbi:MAG: class I SAM-dependent methyltransferase [Planctomycetota bacterium]|nr:class I SAM-dependent methyltransferase [Planctomycetota bacterium]
MEYRKRCYEAYARTHLPRVGALSPEAYDSYARIYAGRYARILPRDRSARIVDVACGHGYFLYFLQKQGYSNALGIDLARDQVEMARRMGVKNVEQCDVFKYLPERPGVFDMITANHFLEHLTKDEVLLFLDNCARALKPGGRLIVSTPNAASLFGPKHAYGDFTHEQAFTPGSLTQVLAVGGFCDIQVQGEKPIVYDTRSAVRALLWPLARTMLKCLCVIEQGMARGVHQVGDVFEPCMFAVARRPG